MWEVIYIIQKNKLYAKIISQKMVKSIHKSPACRAGHNSIVVLWDENDYSTAPNNNQVMTIVETNYGSLGEQSQKLYTHFSLLKTLEAGFELPWLNHACDKDVEVMSGLFSEEKRNK